MVATSSTIAPPLSSYQQRLTKHSSQLARVRALALSAGPPMPPAHPDKPLRTGETVERRLCRLEPAATAAAWRLDKREAAPGSASGAPSQLKAALDHGTRPSVRMAYRSSKTRGSSSASSGGYLEEKLFAAVSEAGRAGSPPATGPTADGQSKEESCASAPPKEAASSGSHLGVATGSPRCARERDATGGSQHSLPADYMSARTASVKTAPETLCDSRPDRVGQPFAPLIRQDAGRTRAPGASAGTCKGLAVPRMASVQQLQAQLQLQAATEVEAAITAHADGNRLTRVTDASFAAFLGHGSPADTSREMGLPAKTSQSCVESALSSSLADAHFNDQASSAWALAPATTHIGRNTPMRGASRPRSRSDSVPPLELDAARSPQGAVVEVEPTRAGTPLDADARGAFCAAPGDTEPTGSNDPIADGVAAVRMETPPRPLTPMKAESGYARAAKAILNADFILIAAGAGFSADSGLPVYNGIANIPAYNQMGVTYADLCQPIWARRDPEIFFGFWGSCFNSYFDSEPHEGYAIMKRWSDDIVAKRKLAVAKQPPNLASAKGKSIKRGGAVAPTRFAHGEKLVKPEASCRPATTPGPRRQSSVARTKSARQGRAPVATTKGRLMGPSSRGQSTTTDSVLGGGDEQSEDSNDEGSSEAQGPALVALPASFIYTSNVDCFFRRAGWAERQILEIHGNIQRWQCSVPCAESLASTAPIWSLDDDRRFKVDRACMRAPMRKDRPEVPGAPVPGGEGLGDRPPSGARSASAMATAMAPLNHERCIHCGRLARPCILMFGDDGWIGDAFDGPGGIGHDPAATYRSWERQVRRALREDRSKRLVIVEAGCGLRVPTVRRNSERLLRLTEKYGTKLIRINPERPDNKKKPTATISLRDTCLTAVRLIDEEMEAMLAAPVAPSAGKL